MNKRHFMVHRGKMMGEEYVRIWDMSEPPNVLALLSQGEAEGLFAHFQAVMDSAPEKGKLYVDDSKLMDYSDADIAAVERMAARQMMKERDEPDDMVSTEEIVDLLKVLGLHIQPLSIFAELIARTQEMIADLEGGLAEERLEVVDAELDKLAVMAEQMEEGYQAAGLGQEEGEFCCPHNFDCTVHNFRGDLAGPCNCGLTAAKAGRSLSGFYPSHKRQIERDTSVVGEYEGGYGEEGEPCCPHASDCATHNMPDFPSGPCDCEAGDKGLTADEAAVVERMAENDRNSIPQQGPIFGPTDASRRDPAQIPSLFIPPFYPHERYQGGENLYPTEALKEHPCSADLGAFPTEEELALWDFRELGAESGEYRPAFAGGLPRSEEACERCQGGVEHSHEPDAQTPAQEDFNGGDYRVPRPVRRGTELLCGGDYDEVYMSPGELEEVLDLEGRGRVCHYERRDDGFYVVWGADFPEDSVGERKVNLGEEACLCMLDERMQTTYLDLRTRAKGHPYGVNELGRCPRCSGFIGPIGVEIHLHRCPKIRPPR